MVLYTHMVDTLAKNYWTSYFGDYGKIWVKDVPKRVAQAIDHKQRAAGVVANNDPTGQVAPLGYQIGADGALTLEGVYRTASASQLFRVAFDAEGNVTDLQLRA